MASVKILLSIHVFFTNYLKVKKKIDINTLGALPFSRVTQVKNRGLLFLLISAGVIVGTRSIRLRF